jgi:hypothetical protein
MSGQYLTYFLCYYGRVGIVDASEVRKICFVRTCYYLVSKVLQAGR